MARVISKLPVTLPKRIAEKRGIAPGDGSLLVPHQAKVEFAAASGQVQELPPLYEGSQDS